MAGPATRPQTAFEETMPTLKVVAIENGKAKLPGSRSNGSQFCWFEQSLLGHPSLRLPASLVESLGNFGVKLQAQLENLNQDPVMRYLNPGAAAAVAQQGPSTARASAHPSQSAPRTMCQPNFVGSDAPLNLSRAVVPLATLTIAEFESANEFLC